MGLALPTLQACGAPSAKSPGASDAGLPNKVVAATREEAIGDPARAVAMWLDTLDAAVDAPGDAWQIATEEAALDALVLREVSALADTGDDSALAFRVTTPTIATRLAAAAKRADDPFTAGLVARALHSLAAHAGSSDETAKWRSTTGCAGEATIVGPLAWTVVTGVHDADPLSKADARLEATYASGGPFARSPAPVVVRGRGCALDPALTSMERGVRDIVVDVSVPKAQTIGVALRAQGAAVMRVGGHVVVDRPYALGGDEAARFALVDVPAAGTTRIVVRAGMDDDGEPVEIGAWDAHGRPLATHAPNVGDAANVAVTTSREIRWPAAKSDAERTTLALGALGAGERPTAEETTASRAAAPDAPPELLLAYARAVGEADDLDEVHRSERARGAYERVLDAWPGAWEAIAAHAVLAGVRRGQTEARIWTLRDLDEHRAKAKSIASPGVLDAFEAGIAGRDRLFDRARPALERATHALSGTALAREASRVVVDRAGAEHVAFECATSPDANRGALGCYDALRSEGQGALAAEELDRVRALYGSPSAYLSLTFRDALADGDQARAAATFDAMTPGERTLSSFYATHPGASSRPGLDALSAVARDAPLSLPPLFRASGDDVTAPFAGIAERVAASDRATPALPGAATAILAHDERYAIAANGLAHFVLFDVRRVSGTTDVEDNAQADPPSIEGRTTMRISRRRIFKRDGRVVEPERAPNASQAHADLAQLEQGDIIEAIYEGWALPGETGNISLDTADLLPDRTAVHDASIELRLPASLRAPVWSHPLLGKPQETRDGDTRVLRWSVKDMSERRIEEGTPKMDRDVSVSVSTATWNDSARALRETLASLDENDGEVRAWALDAAGGKTEPREIVDAVVAAAGTSVKESAGSALSDAEVGRPDGAQHETARTILTNHEGSRTWLIVRALRELGIAADVVIAESEPFSADPEFPPHNGRFSHPLAIAHVKDDGGAMSDVWIDADVPGPPLPAGHVSPELRGRSVLHDDGSIAPLPSVFAKDEGDEVDVRLAVDASGNAKGSIVILLRGRSAQELAEVLVRIVGDERQRTLRGVALAWVPFADVDDVVLSSSEESWQVAVRATLTIPGYAEAAGTKAAPSWVLPGIEPIHAVYPRPTAATLGATFASQGARRDALAVSSAIQYHVHRRVELPAGATVARAPGAFEVKGDVLGAQRKIAVAPGAIEDDFTLSVSTGTVRSEAYGAFAADAHRIDDAFQAGTRVKPAP
jgi:hypothetical protein